MTEITKLFNKEIFLIENTITTKALQQEIDQNQYQTKNAFSEKWTSANEKDLTNDKTFVQDQKK